MLKHKCIAGLKTYLHNGAVPKTKEITVANKLITLIKNKETHDISVVKKSLSVVIFLINDNTYNTYHNFLPIKIK